MNPITTGVLLLGNLPATELAPLARRIEEGDMTTYGLQMSVSSAKCILASLYAR